MRHLIIFGVAAALAMAMSTTGWSQSNYNVHNSFNDSRIRRQLNLSQGQIRQLRALNNDWRKQLQRFRRSAGNNFNTVDQTQWNQMSQQYAAMVNDLLTEQQQQAWSLLNGQVSAVSPKTNASRTSTGASTTSPNRRTGMAQTGGISTTGPTALDGAKVALNSRDFNISTSTQQADGGLGSSAVGTALLLGLTPGPNRAGATQAEGGGGSSAFGTAAVTGEPVNPNTVGRGPSSTRH
jgi:hypothetical protein